MPYIDCGIVYTSRSLDLEREYEGLVTVYCADKMIDRFKGRKYKCNYDIYRMVPNGESIWYKVYLMLWIAARTMAKIILGRPLSKKG